MPISISSAENDQLAKVKDLTRTALTDGTIGAGTRAAVVTPALFDATPEAGRGTELNALGLLRAVQEGLLLRSPNGTVYKLTVSDAGVPVFTAV